MPYRTVEERLFDEGFNFDFFQAVRLLEKLEAERVPVGYDGPADEEAVRFRAHISMSFPPSSIHETLPPDERSPAPVLVQSFFGLAGPNGVLPRGYTELLYRIQRDVRERQPEKHALRDWLDLFNHRLLSLFYRAWTKYRFYIPFERGEHQRDEPDAFTQCVQSLIGLGLPALRNRFQVTAGKNGLASSENRVLARIDDMALFRYAGFLASNRRTAHGLEAVLTDFFRVPVQVRQFQGKWLQLDRQDRSQLGSLEGHCRLGEDLVIGERVWDVEGAIRVRFGPLDRDQFNEFLPDREPVTQRKAFFLAVQFVRLFVGPSLVFDLQLVVKPEAVPNCRLGGDEAPGPRLGWNTWLRAEPFTRPVDDAVFATEEVFCLNGD